MSEAEQKQPSKLKGRKCEPKYRGPNGEEWSGRGRLPRWLVKAMEAGADRDSFRIK